MVAILYYLNVLSMFGIKPFYVYIQLQQDENLNKMLI